MKTGTKTLLLGGHQFILHPFFVTLAWNKLFKKWPDLQELVCIIIHDWGYWGCEKVESKEGEDHPKFGAEWAGILFDKRYRELVAGHSRHYAKKNDYKLSDLYPADKLSTCLWPGKLFLRLASLTGELGEYIDTQKTGRYGFGQYGFDKPDAWLLQVTKQLRWQVDAYMDGRQDEIMNRTKPDGT